MPPAKGGIVRELSVHLVPRRATVGAPEDAVAMGYVHRLPITASSDADRSCRSYPDVRRLAASGESLDCKAEQEPYDEEHYRLRPLVHTTSLKPACRLTRWVSGAQSVRLNHLLGAELLIQRLSVDTRQVTRNGP